MSSTMDVDGLRAAVTRQGNLVRQLKKDGESAERITAEVTTLKQLKAELKVAEDAEKGGADAFPKREFDQLMTRRMFFVPSFEIYGGVAGLYDFGPPGCALKVRPRPPRPGGRGLFPSPR